ncbi:serine hydrolase domain-containing protein [Kordiimonas aquimaris]|uniref:serine hydrolase domain-containing protein n=1 Tax=Kordiimonas aquimaris TaxID=707591 RepID=UPI0021CEE5A5|nr:serine hydrolase domain-containing protein [Kordiimonas aquimaris]
MRLFKFIFAGALALSIATVSVNAFATEITSAADAGLSEKKLTSLTSHIQGYINSGRLIGATTLVARGGKIAHLETYGHIDKAAGSEMTEDAIFRIHSMTKPITTAALMMLWEEGKFDLNDPVSKYIPSFKNQRVFSGVNEDESLKTVPVERDATILDLMRHTSGLTYGVFGNTPVDQAYLKAGVLDPNATLEELVDRLANVPLLYQPGDAWVYSLSVDVQGRLIEVLSGQSLPAFFEERIFKPLNMVDTGFVVRPDQVDRFVELYAPDEKEKKMAPYRGPFYSDLTVMPKSPSGGGGLVSTTLDYFKFAQMIANGGVYEGTRFLKEDTVEMMRRDHLPDNLNGIANGTQGLGFGLGFGVVIDTSKVNGKSELGEYHWGGLANTIFWIDPTNDVVAIFMTNILPSGIYPLRKELRDNIYNAVGAD